MEKIIRDPDTGDYIVEGGDIHVDSNGTSYLIKDRRVIGKNPAQILPEVTVRPKANTPQKAAYLQSKRNPNWRSTYDMNPDMDSFNAVTGGIFNQLSPTQLGRNIYNIVTNKSTAAQEFVFGNSGLFSDQFTERHPVTSSIGNTVADILTIGRPKLVQRTVIRQSRNNISPRVYGNSSSSRRIIPDLQGNFQYNAFLDSHFYNKEVKELIKQFQKSRNMKALEDVLPTLSKESKEQLNNFIKTYKFQGLRIPYYTKLDDLLREHPVIAKNIPKTDFVDVQDAFIHTDGDKAILLSNYKNAPHEAEHYLQSRRFFTETGSPYMQKQEDLLHKAYKHSQRRGIPDAEMVEEKGAVNQQLRTHIIEQFKSENGHYPTQKELEQAIDAFPENGIEKFLRSVNLYGREYVNNILDYRKVRQALKYIGSLGVPAYITKGED